MFGAASSASKRLDDDAIARIADYVMSRLNSDGGFRGKGEQSDLYYTFFALATLAALGVSAPLSKVTGTDLYLKGIDAERIGFVELYCLAFSRSILKYLGLPAGLRKLSLSSTIRKKLLLGKTAKQVLGGLEQYRSMDGGYNQNIMNSEHGTAYAAFLMCQACDSMGMDLPESNRILESLEHLKSFDGGYANLPGMPHGTTTATAAAGILMRHLDGKAPGDVAEWLLAQRLSSGGFRASPQAPIADVLSTATVVFALKHMGRDLGSPKKTISFVEKHWGESGGFFGSALVRDCDCEYTFYALLTLGCLLE